MVPAVPYKIFPGAKVKREGSNRLPVKVNRVESVQVPAWLVSLKIVPQPEPLQSALLPPHRVVPYRLPVLS